MEYLTVMITPESSGTWRASPYIKATMPAIHGHPRTLRTLPEIRLEAARGLDVGSLAAVLTLHLSALGSMPICGMCGALLGDDEGER